MLQSFLLFSILDKCINTFFDQIITSVTPSTQVITDDEMIRLAKSVIKDNEWKILCIDVSDLYMILLSTLVCSRKGLPEYETQIRYRLNEFLENQLVENGRFAGCILHRGNLARVIYNSETIDGFTLSSGTVFSL